jgi:hypothetical protein
MRGAARLKLHNRLLIIAAMPVALASCATVHVSNVTSTRIAAKPPAEILVEVTNGLSEYDVHAKTADKVASSLQAALVDKLTGAGLAVEPPTPGRRHSGAAVLRVSIEQAEPGSALQRFVVGFGAGRAELRARADFERPEGRMKVSMTAFNTSSGSGFKPGILLAGAITVATGNVVFLAIHVAVRGGVAVAANFRGSLEQRISATAGIIVSQLERCYASEGWIWPGRS